jgi:hypothetical protein
LSSFCQEGNHSLQYKGLLFSLSLSTLFSLFPPLLPPEAAEVVSTPGAYLSLTLQILSAIGLPLLFNNEYCKPTHVLTEKEFLTAQSSLYLERRKCLAGYLKSDIRRLVKTMLLPAFEMSAHGTDI